MHRSGPQKPAPVLELEAATEVTRIDRLCDREAMPSHPSGVLTFQKNRGGRRRKPPSGTDVYP